MDARSLASPRPGLRVLQHARRMLREVQSIRDVSEESAQCTAGVLSIGTTHTQGRYVLPAVIQNFRREYPEVQVHLHQGTSEQIGEMATLDRIDLAIATGRASCFRSLFFCRAIDGIDASSSRQAIH